MQHIVLDPGVCSLCGQELEWKTSVESLGKGSETHFFQCKGCGHIHTVKKKYLLSSRTRLLTLDFRCPAHNIHPPPAKALPTGVGDRETLQRSRLQQQHGGRLSLCKSLNTFQANSKLCTRDAESAECPCGSLGSNLTKRTMISARSSAKRAARA